MYLCLNELRKWRIKLLIRKYQGCLDWLESKNDPEQRRGLGRTGAKTICQ